MRKKEIKPRTRSGLYACRCGSRAVSTIKYQEGGYTVICNMCGHTVREYVNKKDAEEVWDRQQGISKRHTAIWVNYRNLYECSYCHSLHEVAKKKCPVCHAIMKFEDSEDSEDSENSDAFEEEILV